MRQVGWQGGRHLQSRRVTQRHCVVDVKERERVALFGLGCHEPGRAGDGLAACRIGHCEQGIDRENGVELEAEQGSGAAPAPTIRSGRPCGPGSSGSAGAGRWSRSRWEPGRIRRTRSRLSRARALRVRHGGLRGSCATIRDWPGRLLRRRRGGTGRCTRPPSGSPRTRPRVTPAGVPVDVEPAADQCLFFLGN